MSLSVEGAENGEFRWIIVVPENRDGMDLRADITDALSTLGEGPIQLWIRAVDPRADTVAIDLGFKSYRDLWQLRCPLPNSPSELVTRGFTIDDVDDFVAVNNRAFHWHPEQGGRTREQVEKTMAEEWFDPEGFRLLHIDGELVGFCWTKAHADHDPPLGEIYVIAIDPSQHGSGLGKPMTLAGLEWLTDQGFHQGMLYVESDNDPANATYRSIGFAHHHTDRAYRLEQ